MMTQTIFIELLKEPTCTLATASANGKPEAATIEFATDKEHNFYFETFTTYRKYKNLISNPQASIVITNKSSTAQIDGTVEEQINAQAAKQLLIKKHGKGTSFYNDPDIRFFKLSPTWIRVLTQTEFPPKYVVLRGEGPKGEHTLHEQPVSNLFK